MAERLIYHWKHGWIPLTHAAALSKAHGSNTLADKYVPGASAHHASRATLGKSARQVHAGLEAHSHSPGDDIAKLRSGDTARVRGMDAFGRDITFNGRVQGVPTPVRIKEGPNGKVEQHFAVSMHNGSDASGGDATARTTVYVKRDAANASSADTASRDTLGIRAGSDRSTADVRNATLDRPTIEHGGDGTLVHGTSRSDAATNDALKSAGFKWSRNMGAWYLPRTWSEPTRRQKVEQVRRALGDKVHIDDKGIASSRTAAEREAENRARAAVRADRMDTRAQRLATEADVRFGRAKAIGDSIPMGQPILVGHHSEGRHRRDLARIDSNMRAGFDAQNAAQAAEHSADNARRTAAGDSPLMRQRRITRNEADMRGIDRKLKDHNSAERIAATDAYRVARPEVRAVIDRSRLDEEYRARLQVRRTELADQIAHDRAQMEAVGHKAVNSADIAPGDVVHYRGRTHVVAKVNKTTVSVPSGYSWDDKVPVNQIQRHTKLSTLSDSSIEDAVKRETDPRIRAAFIRELNRRGIHVRNL